MDSGSIPRLESDYGKTHPVPRAAPDFRGGAAGLFSVPCTMLSSAPRRPWALAAGNPLSFLHVTRSEIDLPEATDPHSDAVYALARKNLDTLRRAAPLEVEAEPALYVYRLKMGDHTQTGVAGPGASTNTSGT